MLLITELLTAEERVNALAVVPWHAEVRALAGVVHAALRNQGADIMELSLPESHARAGLVALQEGVDSLLQSALDLAESVAVGAYLDRSTPADPLGGGELLTPPEDPELMRRRLARCALEGAAVRSVSGGDHLANAHLRLAWEANAATADEVRRCGFDPDKPEPKTWASCENLSSGLRRLGAGSTAVLPFFVANQRFLEFVRTDEVARTRVYRNAVVHRARPSYRDAPAIGRESRWANGRFSLTVRSTGPEPDMSLPTLLDQRQLVSAASAAALPWAQELWDVAKRWLGTVGISVAHHPEQHQIKVSVEGWGYERYPRLQRDPGPFLCGHAPFATR